MSKISDELRERGNGYFEQRNGDCEWFNAIADRIDSEMVELPRDANGKPIHVGETVYDLDGYEHMAVSHRLYGEEDPTWMVSVGGGCVYPRDLTHKRPDSFERIADELDKMADAADNADDTCEKLADLAGRIRKLAKEGEHE